MKYMAHLLVPLLLTVSAAAQLTDWDSVQSLRPGTKIHVTLKRGHTFGHCFFDGTPLNQLVCTYRSRFDSRRVAYPRENIRAVYLAHNAVAIGVAVGAGTGAVLGATRSSCCPRANAVIDAGILGLAGGFVGLVVDPFVHGRAVYHSPHPAPSPKVPAVAPTQNTTQQKTDQGASTIPCLRDGRTLQCVSAEAVQSEPVRTNSSPIGDQR